MLENKITLTCVMGVDPEKFDLNLIYHFVDHYRKIGIEKFFITVNATTEEKTVEGVKILKECGIEPKKIWVCEFLETPKMAELNSLQEMVVTPWTLAVDSDEFIRLNQVSLEKLINDCEARGYVACRGQFVDRLATDKKFLSVTRNCNIFERFPLEENILQKYTEEKKRQKQNLFAIDYKCFLFKAQDYESSNGQHFLCFKNAKDRVPPQYYHPDWQKIDHFKWTETCVYRLKKRLEAFLSDPLCTWKDEMIWVYDFIKDNKIKQLV